MCLFQSQSQYLNTIVSAREVTPSLSVLCNSEKNKARPENILLDVTCTLKQDHVMVLVACKVQFQIMVLRSFLGMLKMSLFLYSLGKINLHIWRF